MPRIAYIKDRLDEWGEWLIRRQDGVDCQRVVSSVYDGREKVDCTTHVIAILIDDAAVEIDNAVRSLLPQQQRLHQAAVEVHWRGRYKTLKINAKRLGRSLSTLKADLEQLDVQINQSLTHVADILAVQQQK